jgi:uroporphyrinogen decarboxylase
MTSKERVTRILKRQPVDRIAAYESFWAETLQKWFKEGHIVKDEDLSDHFKYDIRSVGAFNYVADLDFVEKIIEETDETKLVLNGNGATLRWHKLHASTPEHVDFVVKERIAWEEKVKPFLIDEKLDRKRINFEWYKTVRDKCEKENLFCAWMGMNVFEQMHPVCGHEYMLMGMALDPDWVKDMCNVFSDLNVRLLEILVAEAGKPDAIWYYEDMGFKGKPFMSPQMYKEIIMPAHKKTFGQAHAMGLPVIVHSCGFVEPLVPGLIEAGMDCLQAMEVKAGMDVVRLKKMYGDKIAFMGGMDVRKLVSNDKNAILEELKLKLPVVMKDSGYILYSDHSIPDQVEYETYKFFLETGLNMGTY